MTNRREFLALLKGFGIGVAAGVVGIRPVPPSPEPIHVPNDRLPMVTPGFATWTSSADTASTTTFTRHDTQLWVDAANSAPPSWRMVSQ